jgi:hypothetical protein
MTEQEQKCPYCGRKLLHLVEIDLSNPQFAFLSSSGSALPLLTCDVCTAFGPHYFSRIAPDGSARPQHDIRRFDWVVDDPDKYERSPWKDLQVSVSRRRPFFAADWCMQLPTAPIGASPTWIQDADSLYWSYSFPLGNFLHYSFVTCSSPSAFFSSAKTHPFAHLTFYDIHLQQFTIPHTFKNFFQKSFWYGYGCHTSFATLSSN